MATFRLCCDRWKAYVFENGEQEVWEDEQNLDDRRVSCGCHRPWRPTRVSAGLPQRSLYCIITTSPCTSHSSGHSMDEYWTNESLMKSPQICPPILNVCQVTRSVPCGGLSVTRSARCVAPNRANEFPVILDFGGGTQHFFRPVPSLLFLLIISNKFEIFHTFPQRNSE